MKLNSNNWLVLWAYFMADWGIPSRVDFCTLFWRSVLWTPLKLLVIGGVLFLTGYILIWMPLSWGWWGPFALISGLILGVVGVVALITFFNWVSPHSHQSEPTFIATVWRSIKGKYCPIITIEHQ